MSDLLCQSRPALHPCLSILWKQGDHFQTPCGGSIFHIFFPFLRGSSSQVRSFLHTRIRYHPRKECAVLFQWILIWPWMESASHSISFQDLFQALLQTFS